MADTAVVRRPDRDSERWRKAVAVALWLMLGTSQRDAANTVGVSLRTVERWVAQPWWPEAKYACQEQFAAGCLDMARASLVANLRAHDGPMTRYVLDRLDPMFAPPSMRAKVTDREGNEVEVAMSGGGGGGVSIEVYMPDNGRPDMTPDEVRAAHEVGTRPTVNGQSPHRNGSSA